MPTSDNLAPRPFRGFRSPSYTQVPDELFDELLVELSGAELKVLLYIIRRTFGFKRDRDAISLSQMLNGIRTQDGRVLDRGVGLSKKTLLLALRTLRERGVILAEWHQSTEKGNEPTSYCLNVLGPDDPGGRPAGPPIGPTGGEARPAAEREESRPPLGEKLHQGGGGETTPPLGEKFPQGVGVKSTPSPRGKNYTTQKTVLRQTVEGQTGSGSTRFDLTTLHINTGKSLFPELGGDHVYVQDDRERRPAPSQIAAQIELVSDEFHDEAHVRPNIGQAVRLWQASGLDEAAFAARLLEARSITKQRVVHKPASGELGQLGLRNKMPYFFSVLRDLLGLPDA